ncbi:exodeoxyribonuclease VII large subunit, partial [Halorhodospira neutriphila]
MPSEATPVYTPSQLNQEVRGMLETALPTVWVEGEISNLARPASGHIYFTLKDAGAQVRCALFRGRASALRHRPGDGDQVRVRAKASLYPARGAFQLIVEHLEEAGEGALRQAFEALQQRLAAEGLFSAADKRPLPAQPQRLGVVTSPTGAAIRDVLTVLARRFPALPVLIYPVAVQGEGAAPAIARALELAGRRREVDVLLLTRGGGSLEDLWPFNEEAVARAIRACPIPVVSAVGHEVDVTIADLAADLRAPTPSAAAEALSPDAAAWLERTRALRRRLEAAGARHLQGQRRRLTGLG